MSSRPDTSTHGFSFQAVIDLGNSLPWSTTSEGAYAGDVGSLALDTTPLEQAKTWRRVELRMGTRSRMERARGTLHVEQRGPAPERSPEAGSSRITVVPVGRAPLFTEGNEPDQYVPLSPWLPIEGVSRVQLEPADAPRTPNDDPVCRPRHRFANARSEWDACSTDNVTETET